MNFEENGADWMDDYEASEIGMSDLDLLTALRHPDILDPHVQQQEWYVRLADALDKDIYPKLAAVRH